MDLILEWIAYFRAEYTVLFEMVKIGTAAGSALGGVWALRRRLLRDATARLNGLKAELETLEASGKTLRNRTRSAEKRLIRLKDAIERLEGDSARGALAALERERSNGNHERGFAALQGWQDRQADAIAKLTQHLADHWAARANAPGGDANAHAESQRLAHIADLMRAHAQQVR